MHVLGRMVTAVRPGGTILDLQVIRPDPVVEVDGRDAYVFLGEPLCSWADAATAAVDDLVRAGRLVETSRDDHDVRKHFANGSELVEDFAGKRRRLPPEAIGPLRATRRPCAVRERCRLRALRVR